MTEVTELRPPTKDPFENALEFARSSGALETNMRLRSEANGIPIETLRHQHETRVVEIEKQWQKSLMSIAEIKKASERKDPSAALAAYESLLSKWVHPDVANLMETLSQTHRESLSRIHGAFIPGGSTASLFTLLLKESLGTYPPLPRQKQDIDLVLINDKFPRETFDWEKQQSFTASIANDINSTRNFMLDKGIFDEGIDRFVIEGGYAETPIPNIGDVKGWEEVLGRDVSIFDILSRGNLNSFTITLKVFNYFLSSFPPGINDENRRLFLNGLHDFSIKNPEGTKMILKSFENLIIRESRFPAIKAKYFFGNRPVPESARAQIAELNHAFIEIRAQAILSLLNSAIG